ncbi:hypothetical protein Aperf_G00000002553 [Anoplocephala perfoliata]
MASSGNRRTFSKDVQQLYKTAETSTDGQAAIIAFNEMSVHLSLMPRTGFNAHAAFDLIINCSFTYPNEPPVLTFDTPIFHPNIDPRAGYVCLSLLNDWHPCFSLLDVVKAVLYLLEHPNFDSPNNSFATLDNISELETKTKRLLAGLTVNECRFPPNAAWCAWAIENNCLPTEDDDAESKKSDSRNELSSKDLRRAVNDAECVPSMSSNSSIHHEEFNEEPQDGLSVCTSETVPSFAKIRYSFTDDEMSYPRYYERYNALKVASQRITITQPVSEQKVQHRTVYYFAEVWCHEHHQNELGTHFFNHFSSNKMPGDKENTESRQSSSLTSWNPAGCNSVYTNEHYSQYSSSLNLSELFHIKAQAKKELTTDFCQWAAEDGLGNAAILSGLFFEGQRRHSQFEHLLDASSDGNDSSLGFPNLFSINSAETYSCKKVCNCSTSEQETDSEDAESECETGKTVDELDDINADDDSFREETCSESSDSYGFYIDVRNQPKMHECGDCCLLFQGGAECMNCYLGPLPTWLFRQSRWSIRFAPCQTAILSMETICLPPWRVSTVRLVADICWYCKNNSTVKNLALLDPMALSPMSPLLNLMQVDMKPASHLTGILWMTPVEAISPFYHVPIPAHPSVEGGEKVTYPRPFNLRLLTLTAFVTNWVAWLSRIETYNSTGLTRFSPLFITDSVAACYLQLLSLGCGQAPVADLWPLWLLRRLLTTSLNLSKLHFSLPFFHSGPSQSDFHFFFPFSDIDEI